MKHENHKRPLAAITPTLSDNWRTGQAGIAAIIGNSLYTELEKFISQSIPEPCSGVTAEKQVAY
jgi:hypothetical protein